MAKTGIRSRSYRSESTQALAGEAADARDGGLALTEAVSNRLPEHRRVRFDESPLRSQSQMPLRRRATSVNESMHSPVIETGRSPTRERHRVDPIDFETARANQFGNCSVEIEPPPTRLQIGFIRSEGSLSGTIIFDWRIWRDFGPNELGRSAIGRRILGLISRLI